MQNSGQPLTVVGDLVHNPTVLENLRQDGIRFTSHGGPPEPGGGSLMITAHGTSRAAMERLARPGNEVLDATCPLVRSAHQHLTDLVRQGCHPVVIGIRNHVEVLGMTGDLEEFSVILRLEEVSAIPLREKYGVVAQTTQPVQRVRELLQAVQARFPTSEVQFRDTICQPTKLRQQAVHKLAKQCDLVVVVGGRHSNNTRELKASSELFGARSIQIETVKELRSEWFEGVETVGVTGGTSTPDSDLEEVFAWLEKYVEPGGK